MKTNHLPVWAVGPFLAASLLSSCEKDLEQTTPALPTTGIHSDSTGVVNHGMLFGHPIRYKEINGKAVWQGDIVLTPEQLGQRTDPRARIAGAGASDNFFRWPDAKIPYEIAPNVDVSIRHLIIDAISHWHDKTSIDFVPRTNQADYVRFVISNVNQSPNGKKGGMQEIELIKNVSLRAVVHEIGHAVGLIHEHTRSDRDNWITMKWENVDEEGKDELATYATRYPGFGTFGNGPVDFKSVMIYGPKAYSKNGEATMVRKDNGQIWSLDDRLSSKDISTVEQMYANLFIGWQNSLFAVSTKTGKYALIGSGWKGAAKGIAEHDRYIWGVQEGKLWRTDRLTDERQAMGNEDWSGPVVGLTGAEPGGFFYAQQGTRLWKIGSNGVRKRLGGEQALENWSGTQAIYNHNNALYVIWNNTLYKINLSTGLVNKTYGGYWSDVKGMAAPWSKSQSIYIVQGTGLWRIDTVTGALTFVTAGFSDVTAMSGVGGNLFMVTDGDLYRVKENGAKTFLSQGWKGAHAMGAIHNVNGLQ